MAQWVAGSNVTRPLPDEFKWGYTGIANPSALNNPDAVTSLVNEIATTSEIRLYVEGDSVAVEGVLRNEQDTGALVINEVGVLAGGTLISYALFREVYLEPGDEYTFTFNLLGSGE